MPSASFLFGKETVSSLALAYTSRWIKNLKINTHQILNLTILLGILPFSTNIQEDKIH